MRCILQKRFFRRLLGLYTSLNSYCPTFALAALLGAAIYQRDKSFWRGFMPVENESGSSVHCTLCSAAHRPRKLQRSLEITTSNIDNRVHIFIATRGSDLANNTINPTPNCYQPTLFAPFIKDTFSHGSNSTILSDAAERLALPARAANHKVYKSPTPALVGCVLC